MKTFDRQHRATPEASRDAPSGPSRDLFSARPAPAVRTRRLKAAPELAAARVLCNQLKRKRISAEKKRIIHLICLNLVTILKRRSQQA
jgi:hypothetical protein